MDDRVVSRQSIPSSVRGCAVAGGKRLPCAQHSIIRKLRQKGWRQLSGRPRRVL